MSQPTKPTTRTSGDRVAKKSPGRGAGPFSTTTGAAKAVVAATAATSAAALHGAGHVTRRIGGQWARWAGWRDVVRAHRSRAHTSRANPFRRTRVRLLYDNRESIDAMLGAIAAARESVHLEMYIFSSDRTGWRFARALMAKAREGVCVRVIYDAFGSIFTSPKMWARMRRAGVEVCEFHPLRPWTFDTSINRRDHRKILIVDGRIGFTGGMNLGDEWAPIEDGGLAWRDTNVRLVGPAVDDLQLIFMRSWLKAGGDPPAPGERIFCAPRVRRGVPARVIANRTIRGRFAIRNAIIEAINHAKSEILLTQSYFIPDRVLRGALKRAVSRGVVVKLIIPGTSDVFLAEAASRATLPTLLRGGIRIFCRQGPVLHAKTIVVDRRICIVGTHNLDDRSLLHNQEVIVEVDSHQLGVEAHALFERDLKDSRPVRPRDLRERPLLTKLLDWIAYGLRFWL